MKKSKSDQIFVERKNVIIEMTKRYGYKINKNKYIISFWELAYNLNNCWYAYLFVNKKHSSEDTIYYNKWAVDVNNLRLFRRMITRTINKMKGAKIKEQKFGVYYEITEKGI